MIQPVSWQSALLLCLIPLGLLGCAQERPIYYQISSKYTVRDPQFARTVGNLLGPSLIPGNHVTTLINGDQIFPAMLEAMRAAQKSITFETYVYWKGTIGQEFANVLADRARKGVKVHVLIDWFGGGKIDKDYIKQMKEAGAEVKEYHAFHIYDIDTWHNLDHRTHRKILVVDGVIGFTGGVGIADEWTGHAQDKDHWRDTHFRVEGPAVAQMQAAFNDNWVKVSGKVLDGDDYFPPQQPAGDLLAQMFSSSPDGGADSMHLMYLLSVAAATKTIDLSMAYFVPDDLALDALHAALKRGVRVRIIMPGPITDASVVRHASRALWGEILAAGALIYEYQPTMYHCKVLVVDGLWVSVGSTNFDNRSFRLNDEANLNVYDRDFAARQTADFEADLGRSRRITLDEWSSRPWTEKAKERFYALARLQF